MSLISDSVFTQHRTLIGQLFTSLTTSGGENVNRVTLHMKATRSGCPNCYRASTPYAQAIYNSSNPYPSGVEHIVTNYGTRVWHMHFNEGEPCPVCNSVHFVFSTAPGTVDYPAVVSWGDERRLEPEFGFELGRAEEEADVVIVTNDEDMVTHAQNATHIEVDNVRCRLVGKPVGGGFKANYLWALLLETV